MTDDLITRLTAAIDEIETLAQRVRDACLYCGDDHNRFGEVVWPTPRTRAVFAEYTTPERRAGLDLIKAFGPDQVLRWCAADRKILARHQEKTVCRAGHTEPPHQPDCFDCAYCDTQYWPCPDLRDLAEGYGIQP